MTIEELLQVRWTAVNPDIPFVPETAIVQFWREHPELGSPLMGEVPFEDGSHEGAVAQVFANGIVVWSPLSGVALVQ